MGFTFHILHLHFKTNFIRLTLHSCMFKNTTFHERAFNIYTSKPISLGLPCIHVCSNTLLFIGLFYKIFISFPYTLYCWQHYLFQVQPTQPRKLRAETQINMEAYPTKRLQWGKVLHATSQVVGQDYKHNWKVMDGWRQ